MAKRGDEMEWVGYPPGMGSAKFLPPPDPDFVRVYHMTRADYGKNSIQDCRLKVARFADVNDPFELMAANSHMPEIRRLMRRFKDAKNRTTGLLCFSANWTNPLLWSHYADKHKGICLGLDLRRGSEGQEVQYRRTRPWVDLGKCQDPLSIPVDIQDLLLRTKFSDWKYEQERRKFVDLSKAKKEGELYFLPFDEDLRLKEVILGVRNDLSLEDVRQVTKATNPGAVVFKTRLEYRGFRIVGHGRYRPEIPKG
jgi:hypothetical protein